MEQVISRLGISPATARRDINKLDESGKLKKVRNGAEAISEQRPRWSLMNIHQAQTTMRRCGLPRGFAAGEPGRKHRHKLRLYRIPA